MLPSYSVTSTLLLSEPQALIWPPSNSDLLILTLYVCTSGAVASPCCPAPSDAGTAVAGVAVVGATVVGATVAGAASGTFASFCPSCAAAFGTLAVSASCADDSPRSSSGVTPSTVALPVSSFVSSACSTTASSFGCASSVVSNSLALTIIPS